MASGSTADRASASFACPWPASILLAEEAYVAVSRNATMATAKSRVNHTMEVTFWIADPQAASFYTFNCSKPPPIPDSDSEDIEDDADDYSAVVGAEGRFVIFRTLFASGDGEYEYFIYKGDPKSPSLECVPYDNRLLEVTECGVVPRGDDGDHCLLVALDAVRRKDCLLLHIYSSDDRTWRTKELLNPCPVPTVALYPYKVTLLRDGVLVWVDFVRGCLLVCDVLQEPHRACFIPLPEPLPLNREEILKQSVTGTSVMWYRDVACVDSLIKFVEMEHRVTETAEVVPPPEKPSDPRNKDVLYDSDLISLYKRKHVDIKPRTLRSANGWSAMTWSREFGSNCWLKGSIVDVDDILVDDSALSALQLNESAGSFTFKKMYSFCPILSTDGNDTLYLNSSRKWRDPSGWVVAVDLVEKTLKVEAEHCYGKISPSRQRFITCALVNHLKMTPGIKVSAFQITQTGSPANEPNNTAICVGEADSYGSENKRPRLLAEKENHAQDGAQSTILNVLRTEARPGQNNMPLPQCFNKSTGPCNPAYVPWAPSPNIRSYGNYQSLRKQLLLPEQQKAPSRAFGTHVAPHPYFNNRRGARHHGNSQQHPAGYSDSYGAHSSSGNQRFGYRQVYPNYHSGSGNHGNLQQHLAGNSYCYGAQSGSSNQGRPIYHDHSGNGNHGNSQQHRASNSYSYGAHTRSGNQGFGYRWSYHD